MRRFLLLCAMLLAGCSKGPEADLQYIASARSLAAEWAMVNEQASEGKLTRAYVSSMRQSLRQQIETASSALTEPNSLYAREIKALLAEKDDASPAKLSVHSGRLKQIEDALESA